MILRKGAYLRSKRAKLHPGPTLVTSAVARRGLVPSHLLKPKMQPLVTHMVAQHVWELPDGEI